MHPSQAGAAEPNSWAYDLVKARTHDQRKVRMFCVVDEFTREALAIRVERSLGSADMIETLAELMLERGTPAHIRSDNGPESVARAVRAWIAGPAIRELPIPQRLSMGRAAGLEEPA